MLTIGAALVIGLMLAIITLPMSERHRALGLIGSPDPDVHAAAWATLLEMYPPSDEAERTNLQTKTSAKLADAPDAALLYGIAELSAQDWWGWEWQPPSLVLRGIDAQIASGEWTWLLTATETLAECPLKLPAEDVSPRFNALLAHDDQQIRDLTLDAALSWAGLGRIDALASLSLPAGDALSATRLDRARRWASLADDRLDPPSHPASNDRPDSPYADAEAIDRAVMHALPQLGIGILGDPTLPVAFDPAHDSVCRMVLLAEGMARDGASDLAGYWMRNYADHRKRAGALLAALSGTQVESLRQAYEIEDIDAVRNTQRLALIALHADPGPESSLEFAYRVLHRSNGELDPDVVLALLCTGHPPTLQMLTAAHGEVGNGVQAAQSWLIERFVPQWHAAGGLLGDEITPAGRIEALDVLRLLTQRRLRFEEQPRLFTFERETTED